MNSLGITKKQILIFLAVNFGLAWILQVIASIVSNKGNATAFGLIMAVAMFMPFLSVLIARIPLKGMGWIPHLKGKVRYIFFALLMPFLLSIVGAVLFFVIFPNMFDPELSGLSLSLEQAGVLEQLEAQGITVQIYAVITTIQAITYAPFINMFVCLGEEVGWRGALYPYLKDKLGVIKGRILGGAIWGVWHWPVMILAGYEYGKEYLGSPVFGPIVFCLSSILMGIVIDYVYDKTSLIWIPALMHGAINALIIFGYLCKPEYSEKAILGPMCIGLIGMIPLLLVAIIICVRQKRVVEKKTEE